MLRFSWLSALRTLFPFRYRTRTRSQRRRNLRWPLLCAEALEDRVVPAGRLFAAGALPANGGPSLIYELNPTTGAVLNSFAAPDSAGSGAVGLAFDGTHLYYLNGLGSDRLYELNPATGAVLDSDLITAGSGSYDGLAIVAGQVFIQDYVANQLFVFDPVSDTITRTVTPTAAAFGPDLGGGLAGATGPDGLIGPVNGGNLIAEFNPTTGALVSSFQPGTGPFFGAAVVDNVIYLGFGNTNAIRMYSRAGTSLGQITIPVPVVALGGDGVSAPNTDVANGGFETGTTAGWTVFNGPGSGPGFQTYTGPNPQQSSLPAPPEGTFAVYNSHNGPGSYLLYQDITLPADQSQTLTLTAFYQNQYPNGFITPDTLDYHNVPNQQFRIDIISPAGDLLATTSDVVKLNVFRTAVGDPQARGAFTVTADLGAFAGQTVRLRVAVANNQFFLFAGVDNVHLVPTGPTVPGAVQGVKFNDLDGDGARDPGEPGLQGWTVYADLNRNGRPDAGEPSAVTGPDGGYTLALAPGTYRIRELNQGGWAQSAPLAFPLYARGDNGQTLIAINPTTGTATRVGSFGAANTLAGAFTADGTYWTITNGFNASQARLARVDLATGSTVPVGGVLWTGSPILALDAVTDTVLYGFSGSGQLVRIDTTTGAATVVGQAVPGLTDAAFDSARNLMWAVSQDNYLFRIDLATGAVQSQVLIAGLDGPARGLMYQPQTRTFYVTTAAGTLFTVDPHTGQATKVGAGLGVPAPSGGDFGMFNWYTVTVGSGQTVAGRDFGDLPDVATITGVKFEDLDGDGTRDPGESTLSGWTIYADANNNGRLDAGERSVVTGPDGGYALTLPSGLNTVREVPQAGWVQTSPTASRLFVFRAAVGSAPTITELDASGVVLNSFSAPPLGGGPGPQGLADGGTSLFYIDGSAGPPTLYELDPFTGAVRDSDSLPVAGGASGLGYLNGLVYVLTSSNQITVFDPAIDAVVRSLSVPGESLIGGLTGAGGLGLLFASAGGTIVGIDPQTGAVVRTLNPNVGSLLGGLAYRPGELLAAPFGSPASNPVYRIDPQTGAVLGVFSTTGSVGALGGDGPVPGPYRLRVTPGSVFDGRDFGSRPNAPPVAVNDTASVGEDNVLTVAAPGVLANDTDPDPGESRVVTAVNGSAAAIGQTITLASGSQVRLNADGGYTFTPAAAFNSLRAGQSTSDAFTYAVTDGAGNSATATVTVTIIGANDAPTAVSDAFDTDEDAAVAGNVLANDTDPDLGDPHTVVAVNGSAAAVGQTITLASGARLSVGADGTFLYDPTGAWDRLPIGQTAADPFTYTVSDGSSAGTATVAITITGVNDAPAAANDSATTDEDTAATIDVLANDADADGDTLAVIAVTQGAHGAVSYTAAGVTYTPAANYFGPDSFTYTVSDGRGGTATGTVSVTVTPVNDAPAAASDTATTAEDTAVAVAVLANDSDVENDALAVTAVTQGTNGTVTVTGDGTGVRYAPAANFFGADSFTYTISDGHGGASTATVMVTVTPVNDAPTLAPVADLTLAEDAGTRTVDLTSITAGPGESQALTVTATSSNPGLIPNPTVAYTSPNSTGRLTFAPAANASGSTVITVTVSDGALTAIRQFTVTVTPVNDAPTTTGLPPVAVLEDAAPVDVPLTGGFADVEDGPAGLTYAIVGNTNPALFAGVAVTGGALHLTPAANANGSATLTVRATDTGGQSVQTTLAVSVAPVNDAPSFTAGANQTVTAGSGARSVAGWAAAISRGPTDEANQALTFVVTTNRPDLFVVPPAIDPVTGTLTYIPDASATGTATVTVALKDSGGTANGGIDTFTQTFTITVNPNGLPTAPGARVVNGELLIIGGDGTDDVTVTPQGNKVKVQGTLNGVQISQSFSGVTLVRVSVKGGNDVVTFASNLTLPTWTDAGAGDDTVTGGGGADQIYLGAGNDTADAGAGDDLIAGGAGEDLIQGGTGNDQLYGGDGDDFVIGGPGVDQLFGQVGNDILVSGSAAVKNTSSDSLRKVLTDWNPASTGVGGYADLRNRLVITDDGVGDRLTGGVGIDWFWAQLPPDAITNQEPGEQRN